MGEHGDYSGPVVVSFRSPGARHGRRRDDGEDKGFLFPFFCLCESFRDVSDGLAELERTATAHAMFAEAEGIRYYVYICTNVFPAPPTACLSPTYV